MSFDYVVLWILTIANSVAILLVVRQLAALPAFRPAGPRPGTSFANWTLRAPNGAPRSSSEMPLEYTMLFASEACGPCHTLLGELAQSTPIGETLIVAAEGDAPRLQQEALSPRGPVYDEFLSGADSEFRQRFHVPGTPFGIAVRRERVVAAGPLRTAKDLEKLAAALRRGGVATPAGL